MLKKTILVTLLLSVAAMPAAAQRQTREEYILKYRHLAAGTMEKYGIPASIVMAQALLESDNGNSRLARAANNQFGIKCGSGWNGETIGHDDDARGECFRAYGSVEESFMDHGRFLDASSRYDRLFELPEGDYTAWAHGLRECGYATNPDYGPMLIRIIEDNKLFLLDDRQAVEGLTYQDVRTELAEVVYRDLSPQEPDVVVVYDASVKAVPLPEPVRVDDYTVTIDLATGREFRQNAGGLFVVAQTGDTMRILCRDYGIRRRKLLRLNPLSADDDTLCEGQLIRLK